MLSKILNYYFELKYTLFVYQEIALKLKTNAKIPELKHKLIGVDHIYLYNNNSDDNYKEIIDPYIESGFVDLIDWPFDQMQMEAYRDCAKRFEKETNWLGFIDIDEFIVPIRENNVKEVFKKMEKRPSVLIYWKMFGTSGIIQRDTDNLVIEDFTSCWDKYDDIGKCFYNTSYEISYKQPILHHMLWTKHRFMSLPPVNFDDNICCRSWINKISKEELSIQINHYVLKSYNEYIEKTKKSDVIFKVNPKGEKHFNKHENYCISKDYKIQKYLIQLKNQLKD